MLKGTSNGSLIFSQRILYKITKEYINCMKVLKATHARKVLSRKQKIDEKAARNTN